MRTSFILYRAQHIDPLRLRPVTHAHGSIAGRKLRLTVCKSKMSHHVVFCCVVGCSCRVPPMFKIPKFPEDRGKKWVTAINRVDPKSSRLWQPGRSACVCSKHFVTGKFVSVNRLHKIILGTFVQQIFRLNKKQNLF